MRRVTLAIVAIGFAVLAARAAEPARPPLYWQDPDGKPFYAAAPRKTADGRDWRPVFEDPPPSQAAASPPAAPAAGGNHRLLYYRNPMGLPDTSPAPKNDSMGMAYIPVYADEGQGDAPGTVRIAPGRLQTLGVRTEAAEMRPAVARTIRATGILQFDERRLATVTTKVPGWIERLAVAATGDPVRHGQLLAEIYAPDLVASEEEYLVAAGMSAGLAGAATQRLRSLDVPEEEIARLRRTGRASRSIPVLAPADGVVIDKPVQQGMKIEAGEALYRTADLSDIWLIAQVQEQDIGGVEPGQVARANFVAFPGRTFEGRVEFIYPSLDAATRTARVRIVIPNPGTILRAAMFANVEIEAGAAAGPVLSVPNSAVLDNGTRQVVLVAAGDGQFEPRQVRLGMHGDDWVQVTEGIKPGERVVIGANFLIDAESNLRAALQGFADGANPPSTTQGSQP